MPGRWADNKNHFMKSVLIATPQTRELEPLLSAFTVRGHAPNLIRLGRIECFEIPTLRAMVAVGGHGKTQFAVQTQYMVDRGDFDALLCVGAAGSLVPSCTLGDVVVGTSTLEHDYKIRFVPADLPRHEAHEKLVADFREVAVTGRLTFSTHFGPIASGDEDVVEPVRAAELRQATGALCVAWEGSGGARVAAFNGLAFLEIRCITDGADSEAFASFRANCEKALPNVAELLMLWRSADEAAQHRLAADGGERRA
jgi:adenosylhomocysteine nucleosidase